jgi:hypothetical protein
MLRNITGLGMPNEDILGGMTGVISLADLEVSYEIYWQLGHVFNLLIQFVFPSDERKRFRHHEEHYLPYLSAFRSRMAQKFRTALAPWTSLPLPSSPVSHSVLDTFY